MKSPDREFADDGPRTASDSSRAAVHERLGALEDRLDRLERYLRDQALSHEPGPAGGRATKVFVSGAEGQRLAKLLKGLEDSVAAELFLRQAVEARDSRAKSRLTACASFAAAGWAGVGTLAATSAISGLAPALLTIPAAGATVWTAIDAWLSSRALTRAHKQLSRQAHCTNEWQKLADRAQEKLLAATEAGALVSDGGTEGPLESTDESAGGLEDD